MTNRTDLNFVAATYSLTLSGERPFVFVEDPAGNRLAELFVLGSVNTLSGRDDTTALGLWQRGERDGSVTFTLEASSSIWDRKTYRVCCREDRFTVDIVVEGNGTLADMTYFGGYSSAMPRWGTGFFHSGHTFRTGFNPEPGAGSVTTFAPASNAAIDLVGAPLPGLRHWFFNPPPFCLAMEAAGRWIGFGVEARPGAHGFHTYRYHGGEGFHLSLHYDGYTNVDGAYELPAIGVCFGATPHEVLTKHVAGLRELGLGVDRRRRQEHWWTRPMFCGWGAQCHLAAVNLGYVAHDPFNVDGPAFLATMRFASDYARQDVYERFLGELKEHAIRPGTIVIDDKWQRTYGENEVDEGKWPDLPGFIERRHAAGQRVLLWFKAWDREGVPDDECIRNASGIPLAVDPTSPEFERRLRSSVRRMLSPVGYGADGFKIDFTHRIPVGPGLRAHSRLAGLELMKRYLDIVYDEAKSSKPDALIVTHTPHPYLADVLDMIRLNDMLDLTRLDDPEAGHGIRQRVEARAAVARIACPGAPIDTDNWPVRDRASWREYTRLQPEFGVPSLYFTTHIDLTQEPLLDEDYALIREAWT
ncbi:MAG TPA: hypothetical protein VF221_12350 [Chloroflexota bacterium]